MDDKKFKITKKQLKRVMSTKMGVGIASDEIMVEGKPIRFMERMAQYSDYPEFSGWAFTSGEETREYLDNPLNSGLYNLNTIANYDKSIIPHLDSPTGTEIDLTATED